MSDQTPDLTPENFVHIAEAARLAEVARNTHLTKSSRWLGGSTIDQRHCITCGRLYTPTGYSNTKCETCRPSIDDLVAGDDQ